MPDVVVLFDTRLRQHGGALLANDVVPKSAGDALVLSDGGKPVGKVVNEVREAGLALSNPTHLHIVCHGLSQVPILPDGSAAQGIDQQNVGILAAWRPIFLRITIYACDVAYEEPAGSNRRVALSGKDLCRAIAMHTATDVIAPAGLQRYDVYPDSYGDVVNKLRGQPFVGAVDFGAWEGELIRFSAFSGRESRFIP
jgi:hypothetical protein